MRAEVVSMTADNLDMEAIRRGGDILKQGGLVAFPTETVYGLGGDALNPQASMKIYAAKGRPSDNPLIVHIAEFDKLAPIVAEVPEKAKILAEKYWPGPLTMILPKSDLVPQETTGGLDSVAVRFPSDRIAQELIKAAGGYVAAPSANTSGRPSPTTAQHIHHPTTQRRRCINQNIVIISCILYLLNAFSQDKFSLPFCKKFIFYRTHQCRRWYQIQIFVGSMYHITAELFLFSDCAIQILLSFRLLQHPVLRKKSKRKI